jgi:frataxin
MDTAEFEAFAQKTLEGIFDALDAAIGNDADVDFEGGILTVELEDGRQYVINKHAASQEIWVSSPISGAAHYGFDATAGTWASTRGGAILSETLSAELTQATGQVVSLG